MSKGKVRRLGLPRRNSVVTARGAAYSGRAAHFVVRGVGPCIVVAENNDALRRVVEHMVHDLDVELTQEVLVFSASAEVEPKP